MKRPHPCPTLVILLGALVMLGMRGMAAGSTASLHAEPAPTAAVEGAGPLLLRFACFAAEAPAAAATPETAIATTKELSQALSAWDLESDRDDVRRLFALHQLNEIARQAAELPATGGTVRGTYAVGQRHYSVVLEVRVRPGSDTVLVEAEISRDGELLQAPQIRNSLNARGVLSVADDGGMPNFFLVVQVDRGPVRE